LNRRQFLECTAAAVVGACAFEPKGLLEPIQEILDPLPLTYDLCKRGSSYIVIKNQSTTLVSSPDAGLVIQSCLTDAGTSPFLLTLQSGTIFRYQSVVPSFNSAASDWQKVIGRGATIQLASGAPRAFDMSNAADYQTFQNIWLEGFDVDCSKVGGKHHVVIGTYRNGHYSTRFNLNNIVIRDICAYNVPVDPTMTDHRSGVGLVMTWQKSYDNCSMLHIWIDNVKVIGGNAGIVIGSNGDAPSEVFVDDIHIHGCTHSLISPPSTHWSSTNFQIGGTATGGYGHIANCHGEFSGDDGIEINGLSEALVENCDISDAFLGAYYVTHFTAPSEKSHVEFRNCVSRVVSLSPSAQGRGFSCLGRNSNPIHELCLVGCRYSNASPNPERANGIYLDVDTGLGRFFVSRFKHEVTNLVTDGSKEYTGLVMQSIGRSNFANEIVLDDLDVKISGSGAGNPFDVVSGLSVGCSNLTIDGLLLDMNVSGLVTGRLNGVRLGVDLNCNMDADVRRLVVGQMTGDPRPQCVVIGGTRTLKIPHAIRITDCDFSGMCTGTDIEYLLPSNAGHVYCFGNTNSNSPEIKGMK
jgi:hypothetical protein